MKQFFKLKEKRTEKEYLRLKKLLSQKIEIINSSEQQDAEKNCKEERISIDPCLSFSVVFPEKVNDWETMKLSFLIKNGFKPETIVGSKCISCEENLQQRVKFLSAA